MTEPAMLRLVGLVYEAEELAEALPTELPAARVLDPEWGSLDIEPLTEDYCLAVAMLDRARRALADVKDRLARQAGSLMPTTETAYAFGIARRSSGTRWTEWDHEAVIRALAPKVAATCGVEPNDVRSVIEALPAGLSWRTGRDAGLPAWGEDPTEYARCERGVRTVSVQADEDKLATVLAAMNDTQTIPTTQEDHDNG